ncbi:MAG: protein kinase [Planctomycetes bacterium]|nr:protein kinase [Planctomycetota bacterium]
MPQFAHLLLGQILMDRHELSADGIDAGLRQQDQEERERGETRFLGEILVERRLVTREQIAEALGFQREQFAQSLVGPYRLESLLGRGGAGTVYRAVQLGGKKDGPVVALKLLPQKRPGDVDALARFQREAQAGVALDHPHIVRTLDFGTTRDCYYLVCELMPNGTLGDRVRINGPLAEADALVLAVAVLQALDHASARGLLHRDIKPANILYDARGTPRLADMGLAQAIKGNLGGPRDRTAGTPAFIAPEQAMGHEQSDVRADLYSLGATLFFALTGSPPFVEKNPLEVINQHLNHAPPEVPTINRSVSAATGALVRKLMAKRAEDRYANAAEAITDVRRIQAGERPLALALTPEQAYAPLKVQVQTRDSGTAELMPSSAKSSQATTLTPRSNRAQARPPGTRSQDLGKYAKEPTSDRSKKRAAPAKEPAKEPTKEPTSDSHKRRRADNGKAGHRTTRPRLTTRGTTPWGLFIAAGVIVIGVGVLTVMLLTKKDPPPPPPPVVEEPTAPKPVGAVIDLLAKLDAKFMQQHEWLLREDVLMSPRGAQHLLPIAWLPPAEYDLTCSFKRIYPSGSLSLVFDIGGRQCALVVSGDADTRIGFELVEGKPLNENRSLHVIPEPLGTDKRLTITVQVRRSGVSARIGENEICSLPGVGSTLSLDESWKLPQGHVMGIGTRTTQVAVFRLKLTELSGAGAPVAAAK